jgi:hypothetical protein
MHMDGRWSPLFSWFSVGDKVDGAPMRMVYTLYRWWIAVVSFFR